MARLGGGEDDDDEVMAGTELVKAQDEGPLVLALAPGGWLFHCACWESNCVEGVVCVTAVM